MSDGIERADDDIAVHEIHYDPVDRDVLPTLTSLAVVCPDAWGQTTSTLYGIRRDAPGYTVQAELLHGGFMGLWASERHGQPEEPEEPVVLYDEAGLRVTWSVERRRARVAVGDTSVFAVGDGIEAARFETLLRSLQLVTR